MSKRAATLTGGAALFALTGMIVAADGSAGRSLQGQLASADTLITVEAGPQAPRLRSLALRGFWMD